MSISERVLASRSLMKPCSTRGRNFVSAERLGRVVWKWYGELRSTFTAPLRVEFGFWELEIDGCAGAEDVGVFF